MVDYDVLIPAYRAQGSIRRAISSARQLLPPPRTIKVLVDGALDETARLGAAEGAEVLVNETNRGVGPTRHQLLLASNAEWVVFLDADDAFMPHAAQVWRDGIQNSPQTSAVGAEWLRFGSSVMPSSAPVQWNRIGHRQVWRRNTITSSGTLIRRDAITQAGGYSGSGRRLVDYDAWLRITASGGHILATSCPVVYREVRGDSITADVAAAVVREIELVREWAVGEFDLRVQFRVLEAWIRGQSRRAQYGRSDLEYVDPLSLGLNPVLNLVALALQTEIGMRVFGIARRVGGRR